jgi:hypothetical protein
MSKEPVSFEKERLDLERENSQKDFHLRERDLALRAREVELKEKDQRSSSWRSPLFLAVIAAIVGLFGNLIGATLQNTNTQRITEAKNQADEIAAMRKSESDLILEAIKTGNSQKARQNLLFFIQAGLIHDPKGTIQKTATEQSPSLPSNSGHVLTSAAGPLDAHVAGAVTDRITGLPIPGAVVNFASSGGVIEGHTDETSQSDGHYQVKVFYPLTYEVTVTATGYDSQLRKLPLKQSKLDNFDFSLTPKNRH